MRWLWARHGFQRRVGSVNPLQPLHKGFGLSDAVRAVSDTLFFVLQHLPVLGFVGRGFVWLEIPILPTPLQPIPAAFDPSSRMSPW